MNTRADDRDDTRHTHVILDRECWDLLNQLARIRASQVGGRPSQSAVIRELVRAAASEEKEKEIARA